MRGLSGLALLGTLVFLYVSCFGRPIHTGSKHPATEKGISYLALGDSYTIGQSVAGADRYPAQVAALLKAKGFPVNDVQYIARTGWTTTDLSDAINDARPQPHFDIATLLIGVNDQFRLRDTTGYRDRFTALLQTAIKLAGNRKGRVTVLSIPDYSTTPFGGGNPAISTGVAQFNVINKEVTERMGITYLDITGMSRETATNATLLANDGLHYSGKEYGKWAAALAPLIAQSLR